MEHSTSKNDFFNNNKQTIIVGTSIAVIVITLIIGIITLNSSNVGIKEKKAEDTLTGEWNALDPPNISDLLNTIVENNGIPKEFLDIFGPPIYQLAKIIILDNIYMEKIIFTDNGNMYLSFGELSGGKLSINIGTITYSDIGNNKLLINYMVGNVSGELTGGLDIVVASGSASGSVSIPGSISYVSTYSIEGDLLTLDLFGYETTFQRVTD